MAAQIKYISFNSNKHINELSYNINQLKFRLKGLETDLKFYKFLIKANVFKPGVMNLFERLTIFEKEIDLHLKIIENQQHGLTIYSNLIANKIECDKLECDALFTNKLDELELKIYNVIFKVSIFKSQMGQYFQSTINTE